MKKFDKRLATVVTVNGNHHLMMPSGELLPCVVSTSVINTVDTSEVTVTAHVNICSTIEEAEIKYHS